MTEKIVPERAAFRRAGIPADRRAGACAHPEPGRGLERAEAQARLQNMARMRCRRKGKPARLRF